MRKKQVKCILCGGNVIFDNITDKFTCSECDAHHSIDMFNSQKKQGMRFGIKRIRILIAIIGSLYLLFILYRRGFF